MTFYTDGRFTESGYGAFCTLDSCDTIEIASYCTCKWQLEQGKIVILTNGNTGKGWLNIEIPIVCLEEGKLVFDNFTMINHSRVKKACYYRK
jgi:hypothetical protein